VIAVAVSGAAGRMGQTVCAAVEGAPDMELVGRADPALDTTLTDVLGDADVVVDFSRPDTALANALACVAAGVHAVVGTTGFDAPRLDELRLMLSASPSVGVLVAPNFALGAVLMMRFAREAARFYESVEVVEMHHPEKVDAPSGTARLTAEMVAAARAQAGLGPVPDATWTGLEGARGSSVEGVPVHSIRARGLVAHQEVLFGAAGETLTIRHDSFDRESFMPGVLLGVRTVAAHPGLTVGLEALLGLGQER
jgi:4-hydroxy-tetrahydrodipicolinate reductase